MSDVSHPQAAAYLNPAARLIFDWILTSDLSPGDVLPVEQDLAEQFNLARGTVREALRELRALGIVEVRRGLGTYLGTAGADSIRPALVYRSVKPAPTGDGGHGLRGLRELIEVRMLLECSLAAQVTGTLDDQTGARLVELAESMDGPGDHSAADREFHQLLYAGIDNSLVRELIDVCWDAFHLAQGNIPDRETVPATREQHLLVAHCVMGGDPRASEEAMRDHFHDIRARLAAGVVR